MGEIEAGKAACRVMCRVHNWGKALCLTEATSCCEFWSPRDQCWKEVLGGAMSEFYSDYRKLYFFTICISVIKFEALARLHLNKAKSQGAKCCAVWWPNPNPTKSGNVSTDSPGAGLDPHSHSCPLPVPAPPAAGTWNLLVGTAEGWTSGHCSLLNGQH